ncbi:S41 family peptidase [Cohnella nanjingensis]|uniref:S41 family peptidase n=1 Tax=Cohnella nanjingensis TaxID=1387779 RepID=A0A7X0RPT7_9BACL|nr:S41 family peptidase [Cohnella nanjingensis]MBB6671487.1 S41 family peptidase [Cohnella nanjingensis]
MLLRGRTVLGLMAGAAVVACALTIGAMSMTKEGSLRLFSGAEAEAGHAPSGAPPAPNTGEGRRLSPTELAKLNKALELIENKSLQPMNRDRLLDGAIKGMVAAIGDPYSDYIPSKEADKYTDKLRGTFSGIGAKLDQDGDEFVVTDLMKDSPAERAGLQTKDVLVSVNGQSLRGLSLGEAIAKVRGPKGTKAKLIVRRPGADGLLHLELVREQLDYKTVGSELGPDGVGKLWISSFTFDTADRVSQELAKLEAGGMKALVLDVRHNPGGVLTSVLDVASLFVPKGKTVVVYASADGVQQPETAKGDPGAGKPYPIVVLIDKGTASAAEILAGALRQTIGATLVGETTYGKGTVQISYEELGDGSLMKLTVSKWLLPDGTSIDRQGVKPDAAVAQPDYFAATRLPRGQDLKPDQTGEDVRNLQLLLAGAGCPADREDGYYSEGTRDAVARFQRAAGLPETGIADDATAERLEAASFEAVRDPDHDSQWKEAQARALQAAAAASGS